MGKVASAKPNDADSNVRTCMLQPIENARATMAACVVDKSTKTTWIVEAASILYAFKECTLLAMLLLAASEL